MEGLQLNPSPRPRRNIRWGAGIVMLGVVIGIVSGAIWGFFRPEYAATFIEGVPHVDEAASPANVEFTSFVWFAALTGALGLVVGAAAVAVDPLRSGVGKQLFVVLVALFSSWALLVAGTVTARTFVPALSPGIAWLVGPFTAALAYWVGMAGTYLSGGEPGE